ncbi:hypothetical protein ACFQ4X_07090 [Fictibacillus halophilus]|uniref:hypothetical protein n=1 Tax=Fictibacillus halophilus TaxID=1610490 RepID=UPI003639FF92
MKPSYHGIKFVWDRWRQDENRNSRITFNSNNNIYYEYIIPEGSKMLVYVLGRVQELQGMYEVTGPYCHSGDHRFNVEMPVNLICDKEKGLSTSEIRKYLRSFNPSKQGISYLPIKESTFNILYQALQNK